MTAENDLGLSFLFDTAFRYQPDFNRFVSNYVGLLKLDNPFMDETQMNLAQQNMRVEFYRLCLESLGLASFDGLLILDYNGILLEINPSAEKTLGLSRNEVSGQPYLENLFPGNHLDDYMAWIKQHAKPESGGYHRKSTEMLMIKSNGTIFPAEIKVTEVKIFGSTLLVLCFNDITRRKWMDQALKYTEERYRKIMGENADPIFLIDPYNKRIEECNQAFNILLGYHDDEIFALRLYDVLEGDAEEIDLWVEKHLRQGTSVLMREQGRFFTRNRYPVDVEYSASIFELNDHPILCIIARDTAPREFTVRRQLADEQVERLQKQVDKLAAGLQEMNQTVLNAPQQEILNELLGHHERLNQELQREQALGTDSGLPIRPMLQPFELKTALFEVQSLFKDKIESKDLPLIVSVEDDVPDILIGDPLKLQEILYHLFDNAIRYTQEGNIMLKVRMTQTERNTATLLFALRDTASGIEPIIKAKISDVLSDDDPLELGRKYGVRGLAICARYAKALGGRIWFNTIEGKGSSFLFSLPMELTEQDPLDLPPLDMLEVMEHLRNLSSAESAENTEIADGFTIKSVDDVANPDLQQRMRVLVVEHDIEQMNQLQQVLSARPLTLRMADNGRKALGMLKEQSFDLVLMALELPVMSGRAAALALREWEKQNQRHPVSMVALIQPGQSLSEQESEDFDRQLVVPPEASDMESVLDWAETLRQERLSQQRAQEALEAKEQAEKTVLPEDWDFDMEAVKPVDKPVDEVIEPELGDRIRVALSADMIKIAPDFLSKRRSDLVKLHQAIQDERFDHIRVLGKSMKGTGGVYGFPQIAEMGKELESAAEAKDLMSVQEWVEQLENFLEKLEIVSE